MRSATFKYPGARSSTIKSRALSTLKLASEASCMRWECARQADSFFNNWRKPYFFNVRNQSIFYNQLSVFRTNLSGIVWKFINRLKKNPRASVGYVQHNKILNLLIIFIITITRLAEFWCFNFKDKKYARKFRVERTFSEKVVQ